MYMQASYQNKAVVWSLHASWGALSRVREPFLTWDGDWDLSGVRILKNHAASCSHKLETEQREHATHAFLASKARRSFDAQSLPIHAVCRFPCDKRTPPSSAHDSCSMYTLSPCMHDHSKRNKPWKKALTNKDLTLYWSASMHFGAENMKQYMINEIFLAWHMGGMIAFLCMHLLMCVLTIYDIRARSHVFLAPNAYVSPAKIACTVQEKWGK